MSYIWTDVCAIQMCLEKAMNAVAKLIDIGFPLCVNQEVGVSLLIWQTLSEQPRTLHQCHYPQLSTLTLPATAYCKTLSIHTGVVSFQTPT